MGLATARFLVGVLEQQPFSPQDLAQMEEVLQWAEQGFRLEQNQHRLGEVFLFRALLDRQHGSLTEAVNNARLALDYLPEQEITWRASALGILGLKQLLAGQIERAQQTTLVAREACMMLGYPAIIRTNTVLLSRVYYEHGELHLAAEFYRQMLTEAREQQDYDDIGDAQLGLAQISYAWNDLQAAELQATEVIEMGMRLASEEFQVEGALILARIEHARGEYAAAQQRCLTLLTQQPAVSSQGLSLRYRLHQEIQATLTRFQLASGDLAAVELWASKRSAYNGEWLLQSEHECLLVARWLLAQEKSGEALAIVEGMPDVARQAGRIRLALEAQLVLALAYASSRRMQDAKQQLQMALTQAYSENYLRLFLDEGEATAVLLQAILPSVHGKGLIGYIRRILFAFTEGGGSSNTARSVAPVEPLSVQEHRVLRLLAAGRTNPEIATELVVSVNTVKTQVQSIYRKLNVSNRIEASEVARALNLL
jgi:LuxR family maltose regulon positive regulatory protein